jgi:hypothetical protein
MSAFGVNGPNGVACDGSGVAVIPGVVLGSGDVPSPRAGKRSAKSLGFGSLTQSVNSWRNTGRNSTLSHSGLLPPPFG